MSQIIKKLQKKDNIFPKDANIKLRLKEKIANNINEIINETYSFPSKQAQNPFDSYTPEEGILFRAITDSTGFDKELENIDNASIKLEVNYFKMIDSRVYGNKRQQNKERSELVTAQADLVERQINELTNLNDDAK